MNGKALLIPVMPGHFIVDPLTLATDIRFQFILCSMAEIAVFHADIADVLYLFCQQGFF